MRIFVAGGSGAVGSRLVPSSSTEGHTVIATTRTPIGRRRLHELGAQPVVMDGLDRAVVKQAVARADPEIVIHQMTALRDFADLKHFDAGSRYQPPPYRRHRQSPRRRGGGGSAPGDRAELRQLELRARRLAREVGGGQARSRPARRDAREPRGDRASRVCRPGSEALEGIALRYANLYGPGTGWSEDGSYAALVRKRRMPIVGDGTGVWSFVHVDDAARATAAAVERGAPGIYNVADDEPATVGVWLPEVARASGPRRRGGSRAGSGASPSARWCVVLHADPRRREREGQARARVGAAYTSWREGFRRGLSAAPPEASARIEAATGSHPAY